MPAKPRSREPSVAASIGGPSSSAAWRRSSSHVRASSACASGRSSTSWWRASRVVMSEPPHVHHIAVGIGTADELLDRPGGLSYIAVRPAAAPRRGMIDHKMRWSVPPRPAQPVIWSGSVVFRSSQPCWGMASMGRPACQSEHWKRRPRPEATPIAASGTDTSNTRA